VDLFGYESKTLMNTITDALRAVQDDVWLAAALRHTEADGPLVVDSMRFLPDYSGLRSAGYELWRIDAPRELRWARLAQRGQEFDPMQDELASAEVELDACSFHQVIRNTLGLPELWDGIDAALDEAVHRREDVHRE
jgi:dephospho-CoA kinase